MNSRELLDLLENAIDCESSSVMHSGYTAKEIHRKCIAHIKSLNQVIEKLKEERKDQPYSLGWGRGKDE